MKENISMSKGIFYTIVILCATIILSNSIDAIIRAKDIDLFNMWINDVSQKIDTVNQSREQLYSTYLTMCLSNFFVRVVTPMGLAINSYFSFIKLGVSKLFVSIWTVLLIGLFAFTLIGQSLNSIFFIISSVCYVVLVVLIINLGRKISMAKAN